MKNVKTQRSTFTLHSCWQLNHRHLPFLRLVHLQIQVFTIYFLTLSVTSTKDDFTPECLWQLLSSTHCIMVASHVALLTASLCLTRMCAHVHINVEGNIIPRNVLECFLGDWCWYKGPVGTCLRESGGKMREKRHWKNTGPQLWLGQRPFKTNKIRETHHWKHRSCQPDWIKTARWKEIKWDTEIGTETVKGDERRETQ